MLLEATKHATTYLKKGICTIEHNYLEYVDAEYIAFVDNGYYKGNKIFFYKSCYTYEQYQEMNKKYRNMIRVLDYDELNNLLIIESYHKDINKIVTIRTRINK